MTEIAFWQRESEGLIGQMTVLNRVLFLHLFYNNRVYSLTPYWTPASPKSTAVNGIKNITYSASQGSLSLFFTVIREKGPAWIQAPGHLCWVIQAVCCFSAEARLQPEQHFLSNHSLCSLLGSIRENDIWTLRNAPLLHFLYHYEPKKRWRAILI